MDPTVPERHKRPGVCYAVTDDGVELPVVDITSAAFPVGVADGDLPAFVESSQRFMERWARVPAVVRRRLAGRSLLMREASGTPGGFMSGMTTYLNKLGPENLGEYATRMDRRAAAALPAVGVRLRLRAIARLLADAAAERAAAGGGAIHFVDLAGGPAADCLNALLLLRRDRPAVLSGRTVAIHVLDVEPAGPRFGARALEALLAPGAPLEGLDASFEATSYDWADADALGAILDRVRLEDGDIVLVSSEGGLFEYGSDADVAANLAALGEHSPPGTVVVGSSFRDAPIAWTMKRMSGMTFAPRSPEQLELLAQPSGWSLTRSLGGNPVYYVVSLARTSQ